MALENSKTLREPLAQPSDEKQSRQWHRYLAADIDVEMLGYPSSTRESLLH
jgi:hypothetical protein